MRKGKREEVIKSKRWGSEWTREQQRRKGVPRPHAGSPATRGHMKFSSTHRKCIEYLTALVLLKLVKIKQWVNGRFMKFRGTYCNAQYWYLRLFFLYFFRHLFRKCNGSFAGEGAKPSPQTPPPFVMKQINEIKWNRLHESFLCISNDYR